MSVKFTMKELQVGVVAEKLAAENKGARFTVDELVDRYYGSGPQPIHARHGMIECMRSMALKTALLGRAGPRRISRLGTGSPAVYEWRKANETDLKESA